MTADCSRSFLLPPAFACAALLLLGSGFPLRAADPALVLPAAERAGIVSVLQAVSRHQVHPLADGEYQPAATLAELASRKAPEGITWNYPWGVTLYGVQRSIDFTGDKAVETFALEHNRIAARDYVYLAAEKEQLGTAFKGYKSRIGGLLSLGSLDSCGAMGNELLEGLLRHPEQAYAEEKVVVARIADWIVNHQDRLPDGTLWRSRSDGGAKAMKPGTIWMDDLYMAGPFLVRWSQYTGDGRYLADAARQIIAMDALLEDHDGVWFHAYFVNDKQHSPFKWGRANGWGVVATVEVLSAMHENDPLRPQLLRILRSQLAGIEALQAPSGLWHQVLDHPELWEETSASAMFTYGIARAVNRGWIEPSHMAVARKAFAALEQRVTPEGVVRGTCEGTNIGTELSYYANRKQPDDDLHGRGVILLAGSEILAGTH